MVGQIAYITGEKAPVSIAKGSTRIISSSCVKLEAFFKDRPDVELQLGHNLGADLTWLLKSAWHRRVRIWVRGVAIQNARRTNEPKRAEK